MLAIVPRPRGGDWLNDDLRALSARQIAVVVSLLERHEDQELGLEREADACAVQGLLFVRCPIPDLGVPSAFAPFGQLVRELVGHLRAARSVGVHCRQSVGRSGLVAVSICIATGSDLLGAIAAVSKARGVQVPETTAQLAWLGTHERQLMTLGG